ncbi:MAG: helix-turn-helix domain-containing protein [Nitrospirae bacterium]|nr:MAG: helix-turn-helix domain-containing protein [Nitrospirota bacterium]
MSEKNILKLKVRELKKLTVIQQTINKHITQKMAASILRISVRQIRRLVGKVITSGDKGIIHQSRGQESLTLMGTVLFSFPNSFGACSCSLFI